MLKYGQDCLDDVVEDHNKIKRMANYYEVINGAFERDLCSHTYVRKEM